MALGVGATAPDFTLKSQHGEDVTLSSLQGRKPVLLVFVPFAFSGVCTGELTELRDRFDELSGVEVLAVTNDHFFSNRAWSDKERFGFSVLSDFWPHGETSRAFGVFDETNGGARRGTFLIDAGGVVRWTVTHELPDARSVDAYIDAVAAL